MCQCSDWKYVGLSCKKYWCTKCISFQMANTLKYDYHTCSVSVSVQIVNMIVIFSVSVYRSQNNNLTKWECAPIIQTLIWEMICLCFSKGWQIVSVQETEMHHFTPGTPWASSHSDNQAKEDLQHALIYCTCSQWPRATLLIPLLPLLSVYRSIGVCNNFCRLSSSLELLYLGLLVCLSVPLSGFNPKIRGRQVRWRL